MIENVQIIIPILNLTDCSTNYRYKVRQLDFCLRFPFTDLRALKICLRQLSESGWEAVIPWTRSAHDAWCWTGVGVRQGSQLPTHGQQSLMILYTSFKDPLIFIYKYDMQLSNHNLLFIFIKILIYYILELF